MNEELTMSNEKAKEIITQERDSLKANPVVNVEDCLYEAFDVAIKALEQTELKPRTNLAETSQDTISREAVIRLVEQYPNIIGNRCSGLIADIKYLPSVTQQPKVGKWIKTYEPNDAEPFILWECSNCQNAELGKRSKYCPNCGSYNGGEKDDK